MKAKEALNRINGISTPLAGVQWIPKELDTTVVSRVFSRLEDKRVLHARSPDLEIPQWSVDSILDLRRTLSDEIAAAPSTEVLSHLKGMRAACRQFLDSLQATGFTERDSHAGHARNWGDLGWNEQWEFGQALGTLRGFFGMHILHLSAMCKIDVPNELDGILPWSAE